MWGGGDSTLMNSVDGGGEYHHEYDRLHWHLRKRLERTKVKLIAKCSAGPHGGGCAGVTVGVILVPARCWFCLSGGGGGGGDGGTVAATRVGG